MKGLNHPFRAYRADVGGGRAGVTGGWEDGRAVGRGGTGDQFGEAVMHVGQGGGVITDVLELSGSRFAL